MEISWALIVFVFQWLSVRHYVSGGNEALNRRAAFRYSFCFPGSYGFFAPSHILLIGIDLLRVVRRKRRIDEWTD